MLAVLTGIAFFAGAFVFRRASKAGIANGRAVNSVIAFLSIGTVATCAIPVCVAAVGVQVTDGVFAELGLTAAGYALVSQTGMRCINGDVGTFSLVFTGILSAKSFLVTVDAIPTLGAFAAVGCNAVGADGVFGTGGLEAFVRFDFAELAFVALRA